MPSHASLRPRRSRTTPLALTTGLVGSTLLALSLTGTLSGFTASITNDSNTAGTGTLAMGQRLVASDRSTAGTVTPEPSCTSGSTATCTTDLLGGDLAMTPNGPPAYTVVALKNTGTTAARTFTVDLGDCVSTTQPSRPSSPATPRDLCERVVVKASTEAGLVFEGSLRDLENRTGFVVRPAPGPGEDVHVRLDVSIASDAGDDFQGLQVSMPVTWRFTN